MRVLVAAATTRWSADAVRRGVGALEGATGDGGEVVLVYVLETPLLTRAYQRTNRSQYLGKGQHQTLVERLREEHRRLADERMEEARGIAAAASVELLERRCEGRYSEVVMAEQAAGRYDAVFVTRADRNLVSRLFFGSEVRRVLKQLNAPRIELVD